MHVDRKRFLSLTFSLASVAGLGVAMSASNALALELREPKAHMVVDVPNDWKVGAEGDYALAYPGDNSFHLRVSLERDRLFRSIVTTRFSSS
jgi:hypothetical protein